MIAENDPFKWEVKLKKDEKKPYGTYLMRKSLQYFFPGAQLSDLSEGFKFSNMKYDMEVGSNDKKNLIVMAGLRFMVSEKEWRRLRQYVRNGNDLIIFCNAIDEKISEELDCAVDYDRSDDYVDTNRLNSYSLSINSFPGQRFTYRGKPLNSVLVAHYGTEQPDSLADSTNLNRPDTTSIDDRIDQGNSEYYVLADTLGYSNGKPNFIRFHMGNGHIYIHSAPTVLSNYFLLQDGNINYLTGIWRNFSGDYGHIYFNDYYERSGKETSVNILWRFESTRWAISLCIFTMLVYVLSQMVRRQRIIPVIAPLKNDSVSFVETVGRLYFNKGNHNNLAEKMIQQFLEWVRLTYFINTNMIHDQFVDQLVRKSGKPEPFVRALVEMIIRIRTTNTKIDDKQLNSLYELIQQFYKKQLHNGNHSN